MQQQNHKGADVCEGYIYALSPLKIKRNVQCGQIVSDVSNEREMRPERQFTFAKLAKLEWRHFKTRTEPTLTRTKVPT